MFSEQYFLQKKNNNYNIIIIELKDCSFSFRSSNVLNKTKYLYTVCTKTAQVFFVLQDLFPKLYSS